MKWVGTLKDVHERAGVTHETFTTLTRNRECTMCGRAEHFFHDCPQTHPYQDEFTSAARAGGQHSDDPMSTRQQRHFESVHHMSAPQRGGARGQLPTKERSSNQLVCDMHIRSPGDQKFRSQRWNYNSGAGQERMGHQTVFAAGSAPPAPRGGQRISGLQSQSASKKRGARYPCASYRKGHVRDRDRCDSKDLLMDPHVTGSCTSCHNSF